jgi:hypothetical protein
MTITRLVFFKSYEEFSGRTALVFAKAYTIRPFVYNFTTPSVHYISHTLTCAYVTPWTKELALLTRGPVHY